MGFDGVKRTDLLDHSGSGADTVEVAPRQTRCSAAATL